MKTLFAIVTLCILAVGSSVYAADKLVSRDLSTVLSIDGSALLIVAADVDNPSSVVFTASPDHATIDGYEVDILRPDGTVLQTINAGKPVPNAQNVVTVPLNVQPIAFSVGYGIRVRAKAGTAVSVNVASENKFNRVPGAPSGVSIK